MLWIAVALPLLPLEAVRPLWPLPDDAAGATALPPHALMEDARVAIADLQALALGVRPGLSRSHALALVPALRLLSRDPGREQRAFEAVALSLLAYTPHVVLGEQHTLLLEVGAGLRLFGGLRALLEQVAATPAQCGHVSRLGCAPTAWGAWLLVHARMRAPRGGRWRILKSASLGRVLDPLPVALLPTAAWHGAAFEQIGCATLGDLRRLPRAGVLRRFGDDALRLLAQAYGEAPDPRSAFRAPLLFHARVELMARVDSAEALLFAARRLLWQLVGWLSARHAALSAYTLLLVHEPMTRGAPEVSRVPVAWSMPSRDPEHLAWLLRETLQRTTLAAPVLELELRADQVSAHAPGTDTLFPAPHAEHDRIERLFERLGARLGPQRILRVLAHADHRPEAAARCEPLCAAPELANDMPEKKRARARGARKPRQLDETRAVRHEACRGTPGVTPAPQPDGVCHLEACYLSVDGKLPRPAWLLEKAVPLAMRGERPVYRTILHMVAGPERIEAGWWDGQGVARDYFVAADAGARLYWIFRERPQGGWFLQGLFG